MPTSSLRCRHPRSLHAQSCMLGAAAVCRPLASLNAEYPAHQRHMGWQFGYVLAPESRELQHLAWYPEEARWACPDPAYEFPSMRMGESSAFCSFSRTACHSLPARSRGAGAHGWLGSSLVKSVKRGQHRQEIAVQAACTRARTTLAAAAGTPHMEQLLCATLPTSEPWARVSCWRTTCTPTAGTA